MVCRNRTVLMIAVKNSMFFFIAEIKVMHCVCASCPAVLQSFLFFPFCIQGVACNFYYKKICASGHVIANKIVGLLKVPCKIREHGLYC